MLNAIINLITISIHLTTVYSVNRKITTAFLQTEGPLARNDDFLYSIVQYLLKENNLR